MAAILYLWPRPRLVYLFSKKIYIPATCATNAAAL